MSRSRKRTPVVAWWLTDATRRYKRDEHQRERAAVRAALRAESDPPSPRLFGDPARGPTDGKCFAPEVPNILRK